MAQISARRGATNLTVPLMLGAFVLLAGFMYWLSITAEPTAPPEIVEDEEPVVEEMMAGTLIEASALETGAGNYVGQTVRLDGLNVASPVGGKAFFVDLPRTPFLARLSDELIAAGEAVPPVQQSVNIVGSVVAMNDSIVSAWAEAGDITDNDRLMVEFATHFLEVLEMQAEGGAPEAAPAGGEEAAGAEGAGAGD